MTDDYFDELESSLDDYFERKQVNAQPQIKIETEDGIELNEDSIVDDDVTLDENLEPVSTKNGKPVNFLPRKRAKKKTFYDVIQNVFATGKVNGITYEQFVAKMIERAYEGGDAHAMRFILEKTPKPKTEAQVATSQDFVLFDLSKDSIVEFDEDEVETTQENEQGEE